MEQGRTESVPSSLQASSMKPKGWGNFTTLIFDHEFVSDTFELSDEVIFLSAKARFFQASGFVFPFTPLIGWCLLEYHFHFSFMTAACSPPHCGFTG